MRSTDAMLLLDYLRDIVSDMEKHRENTMRLKTQGTVYRIEVEYVPGDIERILLVMKDLELMSCNTIDLGTIVTEQARLLREPRQKTETDKEFVEYFLEVLRNKKLSETHRESLLRRLNDEQ